MPSPRGLYSGIFLLASSVVPRTRTNERVLIQRVAPVYRRKTLEKSSTIRPHREWS